MAPQLIASYTVFANAQNSDTLITPAFTPDNGEVIIVKLSTWFTTTSMSAPAGGGQVFEPAIIAAPGGFTPWCAIYFVNGVTGSPSGMTVSSSPSASSWHGMVVERWGTATMDPTPAVNTPINGTGTPSATVTTTASDSVISTVSGDAQSNDPGTRAYLSGAVEDGLQDGHVGSNGVTYAYYQQCGAAGAQTVGMSAPGGQKWAMAAVEIKNGASPVVLADTPLPGLRAAGTTDSLAIGVAIPDSPAAGARAGGTIDVLQIGVALADTPAAGLRAGGTRDALAIGVALSDVPGGLRAGNTVDMLSGQLVGTGADFAIGGLNTSWAAGAISTGWAAQLGQAQWQATTVEV